MLNSWTVSYTHLQGSEIDMRNLTEEQKQIKNNYAQQIQEAQEALKQVLCNAGLQIPEQKDKGHSLKMCIRDRHMTVN